MRFEGLADDVASLLVDAHRRCDAQVMSGGRFTASVHAAFEADAGRVAAIAGELERHAETCRARAAAIRSHQLEMASYERAHAAYLRSRADPTQTPMSRPPVPRALPVWAS